MATTIETPMQARMTNPAFVVPGAMDALQALGKVVHNGSVPQETLDLVYLRASQINGCSVCVEMHSAKAKAARSAPVKYGASRHAPTANRRSSVSPPLRAARACRSTQTLHPLIWLARR